MKHKTLTQAILGLFALIPLLFISAGVSNEMKLRKLRGEGVAVEGRVLDKGKLTKPIGRRAHYLQIEFEGDAGRKEVKTFPVDQDDFAHARRGGLAPVTYVPGEPELARVGTHFGYDRTPLYGAVGGLVAIVIAVAAIHIRSRSTTQPTPAGDAPKGRA